MTSSARQPYGETSVGQSSAARTFANTLQNWGIMKAPYLHTHAPNAYNHRMCTLNVYGSDAVVRGDRESGKNAGNKRELICITHRHAFLCRFKYLLQDHSSSSFVKFSE